jgi:outer membrane protein
MSTAQQPWTLQACIDRAKTANLTIRQKQLAVEQTAIDVKTAQCQQLPTLSAAINQSYNLGISPTASGTDTQNNASVSTASLSLTAPLFEGFRIRNGINSSQLEQKAVAAESEQTRQDIIIDVIAGYLQVLLNKELAHAAQEQTLLSCKQSDRTLQMVKAGKISKSELYESHAQVAKDSSALIKTESDLKLSLIDLAQLLQLQHNEGFDISSSDLDSQPIIATPFANIDSLYNLALQNRASVRSAQYRIEKGKSDIVIARSGSLPTLDFKAGYSNGYYYYYNLPQGISNSPFTDQFHTDRQEVVSLNLQIPIFNHFDVKHKVQSAKVSLQQQQLTLENEKQQLYKTIQQVYCRWIAAQAKYHSLQKEVEALQVAYVYAVEKFEVGKTTGFEVNEKQISLAKAISDWIEAKYDYLFSSKTLNFYINNSI